MPSVPTRLAIKYSPPLMTIVYHFEQNAEEFYYHDIPIERQMLATLGAEDIVSHLYMREAYYFNPKQVKRAQLMKLVKMLQDNNDENQPINDTQAGSLNFFERKRNLDRSGAHNPLQKRRSFYQNMQPGQPVKATSPSRQ